MKSKLETLLRIVSSCIPVIFLEACSPPPASAPPTSTLPMIAQSEVPWTLSDISPDDISFMRKSFRFEFDTLEYGVYSQIEPADESRFQSRCEDITIDSDELKKIMVDAETIGLSEGRHGFDRGIDHCILAETVFIKNEVFDLGLSAFGVGVLWPAEPGGEPARYFLTKNCDHSRRYIKWYFEETGHYPGLEEFQSSDEVLSYFCNKQESE